MECGFSKDFVNFLLAGEENGPGRSRIVINVALCVPKRGIALRGANRRTEAQAVLAINCWTFDTSNFWV